MQNRQARGQIAGQTEVVGHPQSWLEHGRPARGGVAQRPVVRRDHDHPCAASHRGCRGADQSGVTGIVARDDEKVQRTDPGRRVGADDDRRRCRTTKRRSQNRAGRLGVAAARHPDHRARRVTGDGLQRAFRDRCSGRAHLGTGHRGPAQQPAPVGGQQPLGIVEVDCGGRDHVAISVCAAISAATRSTHLVDVLGGAPLDVQPQKRFGVGGTQVEPVAVAQVDRHPVEVVDRLDAVGERLEHRVHARVRVDDGEVDLA